MVPPGVDVAVVPGPACPLGGVPVVVVGVGVPASGVGVPPDGAEPKF